MKVFYKLVLNSFSLAVVSYITPGFSFERGWDIIVTAVIIGVVNTFIKPVLQIIFLPLTIVTFGVTAFLINVVLLWAVSFIVPGFDIANFTTAAIASIFLTFIGLFLHQLSK